MLDDPVVEEIRRIKEAHAAQYGYNIRAMVRALQKKQKHEKRAIVSPAPRRVPARRSPR